jgi:hypothetical protein
LIYNLKRSPNGLNIGECYTDLKEIVETTKETSISAYAPENKKLWELLAKEEKVSGDRKAQEEFIKQINAL